MKIKPPSLEIPIDDPFKNDLLSRKKSAESLTELIYSNNEPLVLCVNAPWGAGKSTFISMWRQLLNNSGGITLYINAWENDFSEDAMVSLMGELELGIESLSADKSPAPALQERFNKVKKLGATLIKKALPAAIKIGSGGLIDIEEQYEEALAVHAEKFAEEQIKQYEESKKSVAGFREQLTKFAAQLTEPPEGGRRSSLVVFIDELDRCRPTYAVKILEAVKHFFSVENTVFVLSLDRQQLGHSIRSMYGTGMDVDGYLKRFIDLDFNLPKPTKGEFCKAQFARFGLVDYFNKRRYSGNQYDKDHLESVFAELFSALNFTLRDQERAFAVLSLAIRSIPESYRLFGILLGALIALKIKNSHLYQKFVSGECGSKDVIEYFNSTPEGVAFLKENYGVALEAYLVASSTERHNDRRQVTSAYTEIVESASSSESVKVRANQIVDYLKSYEFSDSFGILPYLVEKIDFATRFRS